MTCESVDEFGERDSYSSDCDHDAVLFVFAGVMIQ